jgi:hypothetical protein
LVIATFFFFFFFKIEFYHLWFHYKIRIRIELFAAGRNGSCRQKSQHGRRSPME